MGMSIEQIIKYLHTPMCGDTVIGEEKQKEYNAHDSAVIILHKYQKIEQILKETHEGYITKYQKIKEVVEESSETK